MSFGVLRTIQFKKKVLFKLNYNKNDTAIMRFCF